MFSCNSLQYSKQSKYKYPNTTTYLQNPQSRFLFGHFINLEGTEELIRKYNIRILEINETCVIFEKTGHTDETQGLFNELSQKLQVLQFIRSGRVAITKSKIERLSDMLANIEAHKMMYE